MRTSRARGGISVCGGQTPQPGERLGRGRGRELEGLLVLGARGGTPSRAGLEGCGVDLAEGRLLGMLRERARRLALRLLRTPGLDEIPDEGAQRRGALRIREIDRGGAVQQPDRALGPEAAPYLRGRGQRGGSLRGPSARLRQELASLDATVPRQDAQRDEAQPRVLGGPAALLRDREGEIVGALGLVERDEAQGRLDVLDIGADRIAVLRDRAVEVPDPLVGLPEQVARDRVVGPQPQPLSEVGDRIGGAVLLQRDPSLDELAVRTEARSPRDRERLVVVPRHHERVRVAEEELGRGSLAISTAWRSASAACA